MNLCETLTRDDDDAGHVALLDLVVDARERDRELVLREGDVREVRVDAAHAVRVDVDVELALLGFLVHAPTIHAWSGRFTLGRVVRIFAAAVRLCSSIGTIGFQLILDESWLDAFYRTVVTATLNGLDTPPTGAGGRALDDRASSSAGVTIFAYVGAAVVEAIAGGVVTGALRGAKEVDGRSSGCTTTSSSAATAASAAASRRSSAPPGVPYVVLDFSDDALAAARERRRPVHRGQRHRGRGSRGGRPRPRARPRRLVRLRRRQPLHHALRAVEPARAVDRRARRPTRTRRRSCSLAGADRVVQPYSTAGREMANLVAQAAGDRVPRRRHDRGGRRLRCSRRSR